MKNNTAITQKVPVHNAQESWFSATAQPSAADESFNSLIPSSLQVSLIGTAAVTLLFAAVTLITGAVTTDFLVEVVTIAILSFLAFWSTLKWLVYRKLEDLNELKQKEIEKLKSLEAYRREFLGEVSHELKTPIFAIQGFIHTLIEGAMDDEKVKVKFLKKAMKNSDRLSNLVEDLLIITQAESGEMEIKLTKFSIYDLVIEVVEAIDYKLNNKKRSIKIDIEAKEHEDTLVLADRERIHQVLSNLVDNAIKYGKPDGVVNISIGYLEKDKKMHISVTDDGPGIEEKHLDKIFRRFYRVDKSRSREKGGTGLGLAICKHLMTVHGENIWVKSTPGMGASFTFTLQRVNLD